METYKTLKTRKLRRNFRRESALALRTTYSKRNVKKFEETWMIMDSKILACQRIEYCTNFNKIYFILLAQNLA